MDEMFNNLKEKMNETVLKDIDFKEVHKEQVRRAITKKQRNFRFIIRPKFDFALSMIVTFILLLGIGYFSLEQVGLLGSRNQSAPIENKKADTSKKADETEDSSVYSPPAKQETYEELSKKEVQTKLLNSVDYFDTAAGKFEWHNVYYDNSESNDVIEYKLSFKKKIAGYEKGTSNGSDTFEIFFNKEKIWHLSNNSMGKTYQEQDYIYESDQKTMSIKDVNEINEEGVTEKKYRIHPPVGSSALSLFPYEWAEEYLKENTLWDIEKQNEKLLGHNAIVLKGKLKKRDSFKLKADTFRFWVDKDTGILVKYEAYDESGQLTCYLHPEKLSVNVEINTNELVPKLDGYKKYQPEWMPYKDKRENDIEIVTTAEVYEEELNSVLKVLHKNVPYLYEFHHPDLQLFSASYEKYKADKHGFLSYSYKKPKNEQGSGSKMLFVRTYPQNSVVRSWGEFDTEKGKRLGEISLNGIEWQYYEIKGTPNVQYIGRSGDYEYEIVSQEINFEEVNELLKSFKGRGKE